MLTVRTLSSRIYILEVEPHFDIHQVRELLADRGLAPTADEIRLAYAGHRLEDGRTLADYDIGPESILLAILPPRRQADGEADAAPTESREATSAEPEQSG